jgi:hypothetical protein
MLKDVLASNTAKLIAACVCPVVGAGTVALAVPQVRAAVHRATAPKAKPKPRREARAKPRVRVPEKTRKDDAPVEMAALMCQQPLRLQDAPLQPAFNAPIAVAPSESPAIGRVYVPTGCAPVPGLGIIPTNPVAGVPEPATWAQMIAGFALIGGVLRTGRRRQSHPA